MSSLIATIQEIQDANREGEIMSDQEINIAIAEVVGWKDLEIEDFSEYGVPCFILMGSNNTGTRLMPPDYCGDLNAMHEAEKTLIFSERKLFRYCLQKVKGSEIEDGVVIAIDECVHATARQRAEAFLRTIGKWKEAAK